MYTTLDHIIIRFFLPRTFVNLWKSNDFVVALDSCQFSCKTIDVTPLGLQAPKEVYHC